MSLRVALTGTGSVARLHAEAVAAHPAARLVAVHDRTPAVAESFAAAWAVPAAYGSLDELLRAERPDVLLICTPPAVHLAQAEAAFAAGAHVVVEKPPAGSLDELARMRAAADAAGRELAVVFQQRTGTAAAHVRGLLREGALGRPLLAMCHTLWHRGSDYYAADWRGRWETEGGGTTLGHGIHQLDLLVHLLGDWESVEARLWRLDRDIEVEDASTATVRFASGAVASVVSSAVSARETSAIRIDTELATIELAHLYGHGRENWRITPAPGVDPKRAAAWTLPEDDEPSGHEPLLRAVFDALLAGAGLPEVATGAERTFGLVAALYASADADGAPVGPGDIAAHPTHRASFASRVIDRRATGRDRPAPVNRE
jgi:predicted dehydrogenase